MDAGSAGETKEHTGHATTTERRSERELVVKRTFDAPPPLVWRMWTEAELFRRWWAPKSFPISMIACAMDVQVGAGYRLTFVTHADPSSPLDFYGKYLEVTPPARLVWTNDEGEGRTVTTVTFEEKDGKTLLVMSDLYPSKEALDGALADGSCSGTGETFAQLDEALASMRA